MLRVSTVRNLIENTALVYGEKYDRFGRLISKVPLSQKPMDNGMILIFKLMSNKALDVCKHRFNSIAKKKPETGKNSSRKMIS